MPVDASMARADAAIARAKDAAVVFDALVAEAEELKKQEQYAAALKALQEARGMCDRLGEGADQAISKVIGLTALCTGNLAIGQAKAGNLTKALEMQLAAIALWKTAPQPDMARLGKAYHNAALTMNKLRNYEMSLALSKEALAHARLADPPDQSVLAEELIAVGRAEVLMFHWDDFEKYFREAASIYRQTLGDAHPKVSSTMYGLAEVLRQANREERARAAGKELLGILEAALGPDDPRTVQCRAQWG